MYDIDRRARELTVQLMREQGLSDERINQILERQDFKNSEPTTIMYARAAKAARTTLKGEEHGFSIKK